MNNPKAKEVDVIIAGGGLSGALMALSLADLRRPTGQPLAIAMVENNPLTADISASYDARVLALAHGSGQYLQRLGVWQAIKPDVTAINDIHISDRGHFGKVRLRASDYRVSALGYVVEMSALGAKLLGQLATKSNVNWYCPNQISQIQWQSAQVQVSLADQQLLHAPLLIACDGAQSQCRQLAGIEITEYDYQQVAVIANVSTERAHQGQAFERFTEFGPIAMLPLSHERCSLVWTMTPNQAEQVMHFTEQAFQAELQKAFGGWLGAITKVGKRACFPLNLVQAKHNHFHRMALIGNASHTIHPIAGQGFNLGLRDVKQLAEQISAALLHEQDLGSLALLTDFTEHRRADQQQVIGLTDSLVRLFSNQLPPLVVGRNMALKWLNYITPLKTALAEKTMGH